MDSVEAVLFSWNTIELCFSLESYSPDSSATWHCKRMCQVKENLAISVNRFQTEISSSTSFNRFQPDVFISLLQVVDPWFTILVLSYICSTVQWAYGISEE